MKCPEFERLVEYIEGRLVTKDFETVAAHVDSGCAECGKNIEWYKALRSLTATDDTVAPPTWVLNRAFRIYDHEPARTRIKKGLGIARLIFDSFAQPSFAGARSTEATNRQLLYRAGDYSIDMQIGIEQRGLADLKGQVLKEGDMGFESVAGLALDLLNEETILQSATTNEIGEFVFKEIDCSEQDLRIHTSDGSITVIGLPLSKSE